MKKFAMYSLLLVCVATGALWATSVALAPEIVGPAQAPITDAAIIQVYGADVWGFRGNFAIHTWIATKEKAAATYTIYQVIGWRLRRNGTAVSVTQGMPDKPWFRSPPLLLHELRGAQAEQLIDQVGAAARSYPFAKEYVMWPGPNSNSFTAWIALEVPQLGLRLPAKAIGKEWMQDEYPQLRP